MQDGLTGGGAALALLRAATDAMFDALVLVEAVRDPDGSVVDLVVRHLNRAACSFFREREDKVLGCSITAFPNVQASGLMARFAACLEDGKPVILEDFPYFSDVLNASRRYDIRATRAGVDLIVVTWRDTTERFENVQRIAASEQRYRLIAENTGDVVSHLRDGVIVWASPAVEDLLGAPPQHWVGRRVLETLPPEDVAAGIDVLSHVAAGGKSQRPMRVIAADGVVHWVHMNIRPFYDAEGRQDGMVAAFRLVDDEIAAQQALESERALLRASADSMLDPQVLLEALRDPAGRVVDFIHRSVNPAACSYLGLDESDLIGHGQLESSPNLEGSELQRRFIQCLEDGRPVILDDFAFFNDILDDSRRYDIRVARAGVDLISLTWRDVTERFQSAQLLEAAVERNRSLAQQLQDKSERLIEELGNAAAYVSSILPDDMDGPVRVSTRYLPSQHLAGDSFDYRWIDDDHLFVYLIDVSGHGIGPALLSVSVHNLLRVGSPLLSTLLAPDEVLTELNHLFQMDDHNGNYLTMWCGVYEMSTRTLRYASAGAPPAFAITPDATTVTELSTHGRPLGMFDDTAYSSRSYTVPPRCRILIYSDGAYESALDHGQPLFVEEFNTLFTRLAASPLDDLVETLRGLTPTGAFDDDCTLVNLEFD